MRFDLENLNPGTWFDLEGGGRICIKSLSAEEAARIQRETTKTKVEYKNGQRFSFDETNDEKQADLMWDAVILNWEGIETQDGKPLECTSENKRALMRKSPKFARIVRGFLVDLSEAETAEKDAEEKN